MATGGDTFCQLAKFNRRGRKMWHYVTLNEDKISGLWLITAHQHSTVDRAMISIGRKILKTNTGNHGFHVCIPYPYHWRDNHPGPPALPWLSGASFKNPPLLNS